MSPQLPPLWRRALLGPMPLAYPLATVCVGLYLVAVLLSAGLAGEPGALRYAVWRPSTDILAILGTGGRQPLAEGRVWTLFTAPFLHGSFPHLALNLLCLLQIMPMVERAYGRLRAFVIYALGGLAGAVASALWGEAYSLGASGAIFALFGALVFYGARRGGPAGRALMFNGAIWAGLNLLFGLANPGISNAAHIGGLLGGLAVSAAMAGPIGRSIEPRRLGFALASLTLLALAMGLGNAASLAWQMGTDREGIEARSLDDLQDQADKILAADPANADARLLRATILAKRDDYAGALQDVDLVIQGGRDDAATRNLRAWSLYNLGRAQEGLADAEAAVKASPDEAAILDTRAHIYEALGRREEAIADYRAALRQDPDAPESQAGLKRLTGGE